MKERVSEAQERAKVVYLLGDMCQFEAKEVEDTAVIGINLDRNQTVDENLNCGMTENYEKRDKQFEKRK